MKPQTLTQQAHDIVTTGAFSNPHYHNLNDAQRQKLTAAAMRDAGADACEFISNSGFLDSIAGTLINALETQDADNHKELLIKLGELLIDAVVDEAKPVIRDAIDNAVTELAMMRQFHCDDYEAERMLAEDNMQRARDMNQAIRGA
jgi:hypothetical protein